MKKRLAVWLLTLSMVFSLTAPVFAIEDNSNDNDLSIEKIVLSGDETGDGEGQGTNNNDQEPEGEGQSTDGNTQEPEGETRSATGVFQSPDGDNDDNDDEDEDENEGNPSDPVLRSNLIALKDTEDYTAALGAAFGDNWLNNATAEVTQQEAAAALLLYAGLQNSQLGAYPADYNMMADSIGLYDIYDAGNDVTAVITAGELDRMMTINEVLVDALDADVMEPLFINGMAQPIFVYEDVIRFCVYVETDYDTDGDDKLDLVKALVQLPRDVLDGMEVATIFEARPYITGTLDGVPNGRGTEGYDITNLYATPNPRTVLGSATTEEAYMNANSEEWFYLSPYESTYDKDGKLTNAVYAYEDLTWYDYYLVRGFAVVESGGLGTRGSEGLSTCGSDLEIAAFRCIIEWLTGDRVAYTDKEKNIEIEADWSNGRVGMTGRSYAGTTQFGLATTGVEGLETIVPVAGIASWYEYTNSQGISTRANVNYTDSLAWTCNGRFIDPNDYELIAVIYGKYLYQLMVDQLASNGDYSAHWENRDYTVNRDDSAVMSADRISIPALIVHGVNDDNVRTKQSDMMYKAFVASDLVNNNDVKLLLHQGAHITPTYPSYGIEMYIGDILYDDLLNKWFSHYLYKVENGVEELPTVISQSNLHGAWDYYDSWDANPTKAIELTSTVEADTTKISSNFAKNGVSSSNHVSTFTSSGVTDYSVMYTLDVEKNTILKGTIEVNVSAATIPYPDADNNPSGGEQGGTPAGSDNETPRGGVVDHDNNMADDEYMFGSTQQPFMPAAALLDDLDGPRDGLMMTAYLVDLYEDGFDAYSTSTRDYTVIEKGGAWVGGGLDNIDLFEFKPSNVTYKVIAKGWIDLYNPDAGYESASAASRTELEDGEFYDYTLYLQPNLYHVEEGHTLALVIFTYDPSIVNADPTKTSPLYTGYTTPYEIIIDNTETSATLPVSDIPKNDYTVTYSAGTGGRIPSTSGFENGNSFDYGEKVTLTATANSGYRFAGWTINGKTVSTNATDTFTVTRDCELVATFKSTSTSGGSGGGGGTTYTITASAGENGSISPSGKVNVSSGSNRTFTITPNEGYEVDRVTVDGTSVGAVTTYTFEKVNKAHTIHATFKAAGSTTVNVSDFRDLDSSAWYMQAITYAVQNSLFNGTSSTTFEPGTSMNRAMFITVLGRVAEQNGVTVSGTYSFTDIESGSYYEKYVGWANANNLVTGYSSTTFAPTNNVTREEMAVMLIRFATYMKVELETDNAKTFTDADSVSEWAVDGVAAAAAAGIINGNDDGTFRPNNSSSRAEVAQVFYNFVSNYLAD